MKRKFFKYFTFTCFGTKSYKMTNSAKNNFNKWVKRVTKIKGRVRRIIIQFMVHGSVNSFLKSWHCANVHNIHNFPFLSVK